MSIGRDDQDTYGPESRNDAVSPTRNGPAASNVTFGTGNFRDLATTAASTFSVRLLGKRREQWRRAADEVKSALTVLERACETAVEGDATDLAVNTADMVDRLIAAAATEASAAGEQARAEARGAIADLQRRLARAEADALDVRAKLTLATARQHREQELRLHAEAAWAKAQQMQEQLVSAQAQLEAERLGLETERRQFAALRQQLTIRLENALHSIQEGTPGVGPGATTAVVEEVTCATHDTIGLDRAHDALTRPAGPNTVLKLVTTAPSSGPAAPPTSADDVTRLLEDAEGAYDADVAANLPPLDIVDRLTGNLRKAREDVIANAAGFADDAAARFKHHLTALLTARAEKPFARHLSIALYELYPVASPSREDARKVS